ncbi:MAG: hypothetical protein IPL29_02320 [Propionivibrio sp.]|jgi:hypothetical protein|nr:hypothetical protein [Propionivibrio sp.]
MVRKAVQEPTVAPEAEPEKIGSAADVDRVAMPSIRADGTPDQSDGFVVIEA